jgi:AsmA family protein
MPTRRSLVRPLLWTGAAVGVLVLAVVIGEATGWPFLRTPLQSLVMRSTGAPVRMEGAFHLGLVVKPHLRVEHLNVAGAAGVSVPHLLDARSVDLAWRWRDVWEWRQTGDLRVLRLQADTLDMQLVRGADGRGSWQLGPARKPPPDGTPPEPPRLPRFGLLAVRQGQVLVDDTPLQTQLKIALRGGEGDRDGEAQRGAGNTAQRAQAGYTATAIGRWRNLPLNLQLRTGAVLAQAEATAGGRDAADLALRVEGKAGAATLLFDGRAGSLLDERRLQGRLHLSGPSLAQVGEPLGVTLPRTPPFDLRGQLGHTDGVWELQADRMTVGSSVLEGAFRFDMRQGPPMLSGRLGGSRLALADLGPAVGAPAPGQRAAANAPRRVLPQTPLDMPSLRAMNADVQVAIAELDFGSTAIAPLSQLQTHVLLNAGVLQLQGLQARVAGGKLSGSTRLDANPTPARYAADLRFDGIDIAGWLRGLQARSADKPKPAATQTAALQRERQHAREGGAQTVQSYLTGTLSASLKATGAGRSTGEILGSLDGQAQVLVRDGTLSHLATEALGLDVAQALGVLVRGDRPLPLRCARFDLTLKDGLVQPRVAVLDSRDSTTRVQGQVNLRDETLALRATTRPKDMSPLSLRAPILVGGTLGAPTIGIDGKRLAGKVLGSVALGALVAPLAALLPLVDTGSKEEGDPCK